MSCAQANTHLPSVLSVLYSRLHVCTHEGRLSTSLTIKHIKVEPQINLGFYLKDM